MIEILAIGIFDEYKTIRQIRQRFLIKLATFIVYVLPS
jgi:hypothetical protein